MNTPKQLLGEGLLHNVPGTEGECQGEALHNVPSAKGECLAQVPDSWGECLVLY